jgi:hypothetical protein
MSVNSNPFLTVDPSARFNVDRERQDRIREPNLSKDDDREKEHHKERKHGDTGPKELEGYVGFANLPNQVFRKSVKKGFEFTLMVVADVSYQVSVHLAEGFQRRRLKCENLTDDRRQMPSDGKKQFLFLIG